jgi:hypothetical protein
MARRTNIASVDFIPVPADLSDDRPPHLGCQFLLAEPLRRLPRRLGEAFSSLLSSTDVEEMAAENIEPGTTNADGTNPSPTTEE